MKRFLTGDWGVKAGAVSLASILWFYTVTEHIYEKAIRVDLQVEYPTSSVDQMEWIIANELPTSVEINVSGTGKDLLRLNSEDFLMTLQLPEEGGLGLRSFRLTPNHIDKWPVGIEVKITEILDPKEIQVILDKQIFRRVIVKPLVSLDIAEGYTQVGSMRVDPPQVEVYAPSSQIDQIDYIKTDSLIKKDVNKPFSSLLALHLPATVQGRLKPNKATVKFDIQQLAEDDFFNVPVTVVQGEGRQVRAIPSRIQVKVRGGEDIIAGIDPSKDLILFIDYRNSEEANMPVEAMEDSLFEILELIPSRVDLVVYE
ncbi:MAG: hypothetical protein GKR89_22980 [Candidatus Latescibacteria bacterium]|nr:hypothetical protein [Candidatus Latescibacterota bacterium]